MQICANDNGGPVASGDGQQRPSNSEQVGYEEETGDLLTKKERKASAARFTIYKVNKASRKKREKSSARRERKTTVTLAVVLGKLI